MLPCKHCERVCIRSNKSSGNGWKIIQREREQQSHDWQIAWRTRELLLPVLLLCCSAVAEMADAAVGAIPISACHPHPMRRRAAWDCPVPRTCPVSGCRRVPQMQTGVKGESKNVTPKPHLQRPVFQETHSLLSHLLLLLALRFLYCQCKRQSLGLSKC